LTAANTIEQKRGPGGRFTTGTVVTEGSDTVSKKSQPGLAYVQGTNRGPILRGSGHRGLLCGVRGSNNRAPRSLFRGTTRKNKKKPSSRKKKWGKNAGHHVDR